MRVKNGHLLRGYIELAGHSYRTLEAATGIDDTTIALLVTGRRNNLHSSKAERLCDELGVPVGRLFLTVKTDATADIAKGEGNT